MPVPKSYSFTDAVFNVASDPSRHFDFVSAGSKFLLIFSAILVAYVIFDLAIKNKSYEHSDDE